MLFKTLNKLTGNSKELTYPDLGSDEVTANLLADFFQEKVENIRNNIKVTNIEMRDKIGNNTIEKQFDSFTSITKDDLKNYINHMKNKSCKLDPAPTDIIKKCSAVLSPIFLKVINQSFQTSIFPESLKNSQITPITKDPNKDTNDLKNIRPVHNLPFFSKLLEKAAFNQLCEYIENNQLHAKHQSAYRKNLSCETAMFKIVGDIQQFLSDKRYVAIISLDSSAAFDTIDHRILIHRLQFDYNITDKALQWIKSYLMNRNFSVKVNDAESSVRRVSYGVPQGSLLGPLFYVLYTRGIERLVEQNHGMKIHMYADDLQLYVAFLEEHKVFTENLIMACLLDIQCWMNSNFIKLNMDKTQFAIFHPKGLSNLSQRLEFKIVQENNAISSSNVLTILGVPLSEDFNFKLFINQKVSACCFHLRNLKNIKKCLPISTRMILVTNLILSKIDYCNSILVSSTDQDIKPLQRIINSAARFILDVKRRSHIRPYLFKLHILPIRQRIQFKISLIAFKIKHKISPYYLTEIFEDYVPTTNINLRIGIGRDQTMFKCWDRAYNHKLFYCKLITNWNSLPHDIRKIENLNTFKTKLKTYYFTKAYSEFV